MVPSQITSPIFRQRDIVAAGFHRAQVARLAACGEVVRLASGIYAREEMLEHPFYIFAELALKSPDAVVCLQSALQFHQLTLEPSEFLWAAVPGQTRSKVSLSVPVRLLHFSDAAYTLGIERHVIHGVTVNVYSPTKSVVDCFRLRNRIGVERAIAALKSTLAARRTTVGDIARVAETCNMLSVMRPYLEMCQ